MNPRTPAEALRWAAWLTLERGAVYVQETITPPPSMSECTAYEYALTCEVRADTLEDAAEAILAEADRLEALEAQSAELTDVLILGPCPHGRDPVERCETCNEAIEWFLTEGAHANGFTVTRKAKS